MRSEGLSEAGKESLDAQKSNAAKQRDDEQALLASKKKAISAKKSEINGVFNFPPAR